MLRVMLILPSRTLVNAQRVNQNLRQWLFIGFAVVMLVFCSSCTAVPSWFQSQLASPDIELAILQVEPTNRPGVYTITGNTTLPDQSRITVAAIRLLNDAEASVANAREATYEILDRQFANVTNGQWSTNLNLWRISANGDFQETWQITQQQLALKFEPSSQVTFSATFDPSQQFPGFQDAVEEGSNLARPSLAQYNSDGELYLQTSRKLAIALPTGSTVPLESSSAFVKVIDRQVTEQLTATASSESSTTPSASQSRSDAPLSPREFLQ